MNSSSDASFMELARALRAALALTPVSEQPTLTPQLAELALRRHRVGPLLHVASQTQGWSNQNNEEQARLRQSYRHNAVRDLKKQAVENNLIQMLSSKDIAFAFIKGRGLSAQLYEDPVARPAKDIDLLIAPNCCRATIRLLNDSSFRYCPTTTTGIKVGAKARQILDMQIHKDLTFRDQDFGISIEIHRRLFRFEPKRLTSDFIDSLEKSPVPFLNNPHYVLYLVLHGAMSGWHRLRWIADLSLLVRKTDCRVAERLIVLAEKDYGCLDAVLASLLLVERVFPDSLGGYWRDQVELHQHRKGVLRLCDHFWETLTAPEGPRYIRSWKTSLSTGYADLIFPGRIPFAQSKLNRLVSMVTIRI
jgi:hypothetical protein